MHAIAGSDTRVFANRDDRSSCDHDGVNPSDRTRLATMLINHDFDWEPEREEPLRSGVDAMAGNGPRPELPFVCAEGNPRPSPQLVIIERARGFSRSTLILAIIALVLSVAAIVRKTTNSNAAILIDHTPIQPAPGIPAPQKRGHN
jgi:hypothetical protein